MDTHRIKTLKEFYPIYLSEHRHLTSRILHFIGTGLVVLLFITAMLFHNYQFLIAMPFVGYGFAWVGHFFFEKNKPATFKYPMFSLASDFILFWDLLSGKQAFRVK